MTTLAAPRPLTAAFRLLGLDDLAARSRRRAAARRLRELDDRMLADIGLTRGELDRSIGFADRLGRL